MTAFTLDRPLEPPLADSPDMPEYEGIALITGEPDMEEPPYYREPHSTVVRFIVTASVRTDRSPKQVLSKHGPTASTT
jgi:hypothetical protein